MPLAKDASAVRVHARTRGADWERGKNKKGGALRSPIYLTFTSLASCSRDSPCYLCFFFPTNPPHLGMLTELKMFRRPDV